MDDDSRIEALEREVKQLRADLVELVGVFAHEVGKSRAIQQAVLALVSAAPISTELDEALAKNLAQMEATIVHTIVLEDHLDGMQQLQGMLLNARERSNTIRTFTAFWTPVPTGMAPASAI